MSSLFPKYTVSVGPVAKILTQGLKEVPALAIPNPKKLQWGNATASQDHWRLHMLHFQKSKRK